MFPSITYRRYARRTGARFVIQTRTSACQSCSSLVPYRLSSPPDRSLMFARSSSHASGTKVSNCRTFRGARRVHARVGKHHSARPQSLRAATRMAYSVSASRPLTTALSVGTPPTSSAGPPLPPPPPSASQAGFC
eukprot:jgi/Chrpa1/11071/Chrysochromulina_OHIO_Genome00016992-RA